MKKILKTIIYRDIKNDIFKSKIKTYSHNKEEVISALAIEVNKILTELDITDFTFYNILQSITINSSMFKEDLICKK